MLEKQQLEALELNPLVSLSDHDDIEAPVTLRVLPRCRRVPISVEWTVPYLETFFHIGVHNIPLERSREMMRAMAKYTAGDSDMTLTELFEAVTTAPETLVVFNHPHWDEKGIGHAQHVEVARRFSTEFREFLHAFELNGLRPWRENHAVLRFGDEFKKPLIAGGDRHGAEPNTLLNLTHASTFAEFVQEIRLGWSEILITNQYLEPLCMRILQNLEDILGVRETHAYGWTRWYDRCFYRCNDGITRSFRELWGEEPAVIRLLTRGMDLLRHPQFKQAFRLAFARREEVVL